VGGGKRLQPEVGGLLGMVSLGAHVDRECKRKPPWTHSCRPADAHLVPPRAVELAEQVPRFEAAGQGVGGKLEAETCRQHRVGRGQDL